MKAILSIFCLLFFYTLSAQEADSTAVTAPKDKEEEIFTVVEEVPQFPGGEQAMMIYVYRNLRYPPLALENNIQGKVVVQFIIDETGKVDSVKIVSKPLGWGIEEEAIRVVESMPTWTPGKQKGKGVRVRYVLPIRFKIDNPEPQKKKKRRR